MPHQQHIYDTIMILKYNHTQKSVYELPQGPAKTRPVQRQLRDIEHKTAWKSSIVQISTSQHVVITLQKENDWLFIRACASMQVLVDGFVTSDYTLTWPNHPQHAWEITLWTWYPQLLLVQTPYWMIVLYSNMARGSWANPAVSSEKICHMQTNGDRWGPYSTYHDTLGSSRVQRIYNTLSLHDFQVCFDCLHVLPTLFWGSTKLFSGSSSDIPAPPQRYDQTNTHWIPLY